MYTHFKGGKHLTESGVWSEYMYFPEEPEDRKVSAPVIYTIAAISALILIILAVVLVSNSQSRSGAKKRADALAAASATEAPVAEEETEADYGDASIEKLYREHKLRAEDLDFWDMYDGAGTTVEEEPSPSPSESPSPDPSATPTEEELEADGKHIQVTYKDGTEEWIEINDKLPKADYDFTKLKITNGKMAYYSGNKKLSRLGVMISSESGTVDFDRLSEDGIDFVMLKVGGRGYGTGLITLDTDFTERIEAAQKAGLSVGCYFSSQAVTVQEAVEEAAFVKNQLLPYKITYPVALQMENIETDTARTDILDEKDRTEIAQAFLKDIEDAGYQGILYGDTNFLLTDVLPAELFKSYDVFLEDEEAVPAYPYQYKMWEYAMQETVNGIEKPTSYVISFTDYANK